MVKVMLELWQDRQIILSVLPVVTLRAVISSLEESGHLIPKSSRCITAIHSILGEVLDLL